MKFVLLKENLFVSFQLKTLEVQRLYTDLQASKSSAKSSALIMKIIVFSAISVKLKSARLSFRHIHECHEREEFEESFFIFTAILIEQ